MPSTSRLRHVCLPRFVAAVLVGTACASVALADTPGAACLDIDDDEARLECFDREVGAAVRGDEAVTEAEIPAASPVPATPAADESIARCHRRLDRRLNLPV